MPPGRKTWGHFYLSFTHLPTQVLDLSIKHISPTPHWEELVQGAPT